MKQQVLTEWSSWAELGVKAEPSRTLTPSPHLSTWHLRRPPATGAQLPDPVMLMSLKQTPVCQLLSLSQEGHKCWCFTAEKGFCTMHSLTDHTLLIPALIWVPCTRCRLPARLLLYPSHCRSITKMLFAITWNQGNSFPYGTSVLAPPASQQGFVHLFRTGISLTANCFCCCQAAFPACPGQPARG